MATGTIKDSCLKVVSATATVSNDNYLDVHFSNISGWKIIGVVGINQAATTIVGFFPNSDTSIRIYFPTLISASVTVYALISKI